MQSEHMEEKKPPLTNLLESQWGRGTIWVGYAIPKHALPTKHLTMECRMVKQKKPPST
jgi:hypothetical protein